MDTKDWVLVMALGGIIALIGAVASDGNNPVTAWLGLGIAAVGLIGWQVNARLALRRDQRQP